MSTVKRAINQLEWTMATLAGLAMVFATWGAYKAWEPLGWFALAADTFAVAVLLSIVAKKIEKEAK